MLHFSSTIAVEISEGFSFSIMKDLVTQASGWEKSYMYLHLIQRPSVAIQRHAWPHKWLSLRKSESELL